METLLGSEPIHEFMTEQQVFNAAATLLFTQEVPCMLTLPNGELDDKIRTYVNDMGHICPSALFLVGYDEEAYELTPYEDLVKNGWQPPDRDWETYTVLPE